MKLKLRVGDFRVRELLAEDTVGERGPHRVYRVTKRKLTSPEAAEILAKQAGVEIGEVSMAGLKDRQGITIQHMSVPHGRDVLVESEGLKIEAIGFAAEPLSSAVSLGNAFEITARALQGGDLERLRHNMTGVRAIGLPNYFDDQRFGNLRHGQGWIALDLMRGDIEGALRTLLCHVGQSDADHLERFKQRLEQGWGDFSRLAEEARRYGRHRSVFEHLAAHPGDFAGAFRFVSTRERLIHLYAFQSHLWNRAVADLFREGLPEAERLVVECNEGRLVCPAERLPAGIDPGATFMLPGERLADVQVPRQRELLADGLARHGLVPSQFEIHGVEGFQIKGEPRALLVVPRHLRVRPAEPDPEHPGLRLVKLRFELPRGAYATLVVKRLFARAPGEVEGQDGGDEPLRGERRQGPRSYPAGPARRGGPGERGRSYEAPRSESPRSEPFARPRQRDQGGFEGRDGRRDDGPRGRPDGGRPDRRGPGGFAPGGRGPRREPWPEGAPPPDRRGRPGGPGRPYGSGAPGPDAERGRGRGQRPWPEDQRPGRGDRPYGDRPYGDRPYGERPYGNRPYGDRPNGDRPNGDRPYADRPGGDRPYGERPFRERPGGHRPYGERPYGARGPGFQRPDRRAPGPQGPGWQGAGGPDRPPRRSDGPPPWDRDQRGPRDQGPRGGARPFDGRPDAERGPGPRRFDGPPRFDRGPAGRGRRAPGPGAAFDRGPGRGQGDDELRGGFAPDRRQDRPRREDSGPARGGSDSPPRPRKGPKPERGGGPGGPRREPPPANDGGGAPERAPQE
jgi:tRNA pseudouridine13 synthase